MKNKNENSLLTKKDIDKAAWSYIFFAQATQNFERMMGLAFCHVMEPILKKLYKNKPDEYKKALQRHMQFYNTEPQLGALIPGITIAMEEARAKGEDVSEELKRFFRLVLEAKREKFLQFMTWSYIDLYREEKHILIGKLTTAVPSERLVQHLVELIGARTHENVELDARIDPNIIGGYIIELSGFRLDASVANQLKRVKQQFIARNRRIV